MFNIYDNIMYYARIRNMSIREIESLAGLSNGTLRKWNYSDPGVSKVDLVSNILRVDIYDLLRGPRVSNINDNLGATHMLTSGGLLNNIETKTSDFLNKTVSEYDRIFYNTNIINNLGYLISSNTIFLIDKLSLPIPYFQNGSLNNKLVLIFNKRTITYLLGWIKHDINMLESPPMVIPYIGNQASFYFDNNFHEIRSVCRGVITIF